MNLRLLILALGTFAIGTGSFVFAGLLDSVARDFSVSVGAAGQLISVYAVVYAIGSPILVTLTSRVARKWLLLVSLLLFVIANVAAVLIPDFGPLILSRIVAACGAAIFTPTAAATAASLAPPEKRGRALAIVTGGLTIAFAFGIPLGALIGEWFGWRGAFVLVGILGAVAVAGILLLLPEIEPPPPVSLRERFSAVREPAILVTLGLTAIGLGSGFVLFTYIDPLLRGLTGLGGDGVSGLLLVFGVAAVAGNALGGYGADRWGYRRTGGVIFCVLAASFALISLLAPVSGTSLAVIGVGVALVPWSVAGWALTPFQQYRLIELSPRQSNLVLSLNASAIYVGQGTGAALGALVLVYGSLDTLGWVAALCAATGLIIIAVGVRPAVEKDSSQG